MTLDFLDKRNEVRELVEDAKKAKINWVMTVTQLTFDELEQIAKDLGFVIKGEFIALPEAADKITDPSIKAEIKKPTYSKEQLASYNLMHCPGCAIILKDADEKADLVGYCPNCGIDFNDIFRMSKSDGYFQRRCNNCGTINPVKVSFCFRCGNGQLTRIVPVSKRAKKIRPGRGRNLRTEMKVGFVIGFILVVGMLIWSVVELTSNIGTISTGVAVSIIVIGALLLAVPSYYLYQYSLWREYQRYKWYFDDD